MSARRASDGPGEARRRGRLSHEDMTLWAEVARSASPLHGQARLRGSTSMPSAEPRASPPPGRPPAEPPLPRTLRPTGPAEPATRVFGGAPDPAPVGRPEPGLDRRTAERIRRGERDPDARIDLHGLTAADAHARLDAFLAGAAARGHRLLLVITGKGRPGRGLLRDAVPGWLRASGHGRRILGVFQAHPRHGGAGALYVYLKKPR